MRSILVPISLISLLLILSNCLRSFLSSTAEAIAQVEKELSSDERKDQTEGNSLADNFFFNVAFIVIVVAFWLKYFNVV